MPGSSKPPFRLIVTDLDGTLLNSDHEVSPLTENALRKAIAQGVLFTVATGKTYPSTLGWIRRFNICIPVICGNGTIVHAPDGTILYEDPIPRELAIEAIHMAQSAGLVPIVYAGPGLLATKWDANIEVLVEHHEPHPQIVPDLAAALEADHKPHKLLFMNEHDLDAVVAFQAALNAAFTGRAQVLRSGLASVVELLPQSATKGAALAFILEYLDIPAEQTISFGDNFNDLDMIRRAGIGVAMPHAPEAVRLKADYVTRSNDDDGVGHAIHKFVLAPHAANMAQRCEPQR
ncbi:MAG: HAD family phosphatase [Anaerolineae bacterium]|nr:HAD family phosphatase [Anaerolineae bacterium]